MDYDIIIIGAGPGGYETALEASARYGMKTALIEKRDIGGTCLNRGCIPTKTFLHTAELYEEVRNKGEVFGFTGNEGLSVDMSHLQKRKAEVVETLRAGIEKQLKSAKVDVYRGVGSIIAPGRVRVHGDDEAELSCRYIVIATGSKPDKGSAEHVEASPGLGGDCIRDRGSAEHVEASPGLGGDCVREKGSAEHVEASPGSGQANRVLTSDEILDLDHVPESLLILGGGVIGMEIACVFNALGCRVTVLKASSKIFNDMDKELGQSLKMLMKKRGVEIISGVNVKRIEEAEGGVNCVYADGSDEDAPDKVISADKVLLAKGRLSETESLIDGEASEELRGLEFDHRGRIVTDEHFRTGVEGIYAIGDCISGKDHPGHAMLAHVATAEGRALLAGLNAGTAGSGAGSTDTSGDHDKSRDCPSTPDLSVVPACIYTFPEIASVGADPEVCKAEGRDVVVKKYPMGANGKSVLTQQERGFIKVVADAGSRKIIGASMMCARATDMISVFTEAIVNSLTIEDMQRVIFPHPTFCEGIGETLR